MTTRSAALTTTSFSLILLGTGLCALLLNAFLPARSAQLKLLAAQPTDALYLPSGSGLEFLSLGYRNALSNGLWLKTVNYFGKHYSQDQDYRYLNHLCALVIRLNPRTYDPYYFCSTMLAWELNQPTQALAILTEATKAHPNDWFFWYQRGFYQMYFLKNPDAAQEDFATAAAQPNAHPIAARLAAKKLADIDTPAAAIDFLRSMLSRTSDESQRKTFEERILELQHEEALQTLEARLSQLTQQYSLADAAALLNRELDASSLRDPWGADYRVDRSTGTVTSESNRKRLRDVGRKQSLSISTAR